MTRHVRSLTTREDLLFADVELAGPAGTIVASLVLDTGAVATTVTPAVIHKLGYSERDAYKTTRIRTAVGVEYGYLILAEKLTALGVTIYNFPIHVFPLGHDVEGLIGLDYLRYFNFEVRPSELLILTEPIR